MSVSEPFIRRPIATSLLAMAIVLAGVGAYSMLPVAPLPRVDFPTINVGAGLPGASPETMAAAVATPLERRFGRIAGINEITSVSSLGSVSLTLQFALDRDVEAAARDVQAAINAAGGDLPANMPSRPNYRKVNPADAPILILSLTSRTIPLGKVYEDANSILAQKISQVPGVGQVYVGGGQQPAVRVQVDTEKLAGLGLGMDDVRSVLSSASVDAPKGAVGGALQMRSIAANDQLLHADQYKPLIISAKGGQIVRLQDVARVIDDVENNRVAAWSGATRAVLVIIRRQPGANIIEVIDHIKALLPQLAKSMSPAVDIGIAGDRSQTIRASVHDVQLTLIISILLVVLVVFAFLRSAWATAIPSVAVPLALLGTFAAMWLCGYSLDNLSLMALTISTGFVVDDAIVVTENIARLIEHGKKPLEAALEGAKQIGFTIVSITVSLLAVFIPIMLMGGIIGRLFREFAVTLGMAVAISAVVSLTLTPMMASRMLRDESHRKHGKVWQWFEHGFEALVRFYDRGLSWVIDHEKLMLVVMGLTVAVTVWLYVVVPKGLFPQQDTGTLNGFSEAPQDISFAAMKERQQVINEVVMAHPAVAHMVSFIGGGSLNTGNMFIELKPLAERKESADQVIADLRPKLARVPGINLFLQSVQDVRMGGRSTRTQYQYAIQTAQLSDLQEWAPKVFNALKGLKELKDVATDQQTAGLQMSLAIDRDTAARMGITPALIDSALYDSFGQRQVATLFTQAGQYRVVLEALPEHNNTPDALDRVYVKPATGGQPVSIATFTRVKTDPTPLSINHQGQFPAVTLSFNLAEGVSLGQAVDAIRKAELKIGLPPSVHADFQGTAQAFQDSLASEPFLVLAALIAVYIVLGVLYESLIHPITILSTLPSAGIGALLALIIFHTEFSIIALIGIILLIGIVKKNAIMMIDFAIEAERERGLSAHDAIHEASLLRFRPILMTTMAAMLGGLPLALGHGAGAELRRPLGIAIVGGLLFSQMLTLYTTPVVYLALDKFTKRRERRRTERLEPQRA